VDIALMLGIQTQGYTAVDFPPFRKRNQEDEHKRPPALEKTQRRGPGRPSGELTQIK
jgi:hypothetical protein